MVVTEGILHGETGAFELPRHFGNRQRAKRQLETVFAQATAAALDVALLERREPAAAVLADRLDERQMSIAVAAAQLDLVAVFLPVRHVGHEVDAERPALSDHARDRIERLREIARPRQ